MANAYCEVINPSNLEGFIGKKSLEIKVYSF